MYSVCQCKWIDCGFKHIPLITVILTSIAVISLKAASTLITAQLNYHTLPTNFNSAAHSVCAACTGTAWNNIAFSQRTQSKSFAHTQEANCWHLCCFAAENKVLAGKAGALQVVLAGLEHHKSSEPVTQYGFLALANICINGITVTECAK